ncbi:hypothetical protein [Clostridium sp. C105KSO13]|uniref:hypothetical protein n=1 Tax=Clostridium sp. C105KSO13 TaxID=1776045 RepID=UPI0007407E75|nr:hypothetical protein [Clostridium sp. C105KSO13]CUX24270.1 hypothetical protein BN3456_00722 [Clostridium sp. C105KSO13]
MIDYEYAKAITELLVDETLTEELFCMRMQAIQQLRAIAARYEKERFMEKLVEPVFCKKAAFIMAATTKAQIKEIMEPSVPFYSGGMFYPRNDYHVEEEELLLWSKASLAGLLIPSGVKRFEELFEKYCDTKSEDSAA